MLSRRNDEADELRRSIERHYDSLGFLYRRFWGEHIHHGYWTAPELSVRKAQEQLVAHLAARARIDSRDRVLDVGCGYGASCRWLASSLGCHVTAVTISSKQARLTRRDNLRRGFGAQTSVLRADAARLPLVDGAFDVVWSIECLEHLDDKARFVRSAARLLRPGGRLAVCSWLRGDGIPSGRRLIHEVCEAFLCPSLASERDYRVWCQAADLDLRVAEDLTPYVQRTWEILMKRLRSLAPLRPFAGVSLRRFINGFPKIYEAYLAAEMKYGVIVAEQSGGVSGSGER